jgi:hypothetical protein
MKNQAIITLVMTHLVVSVPKCSNPYPWFERVLEPLCLCLCLRKLVLHVLL